VFERTPRLPGCATIPPHAPLPISAELPRQAFGVAPDAVTSRSARLVRPGGRAAAATCCRRPRRDVATAAALLVAGIAWGAALAFTESLPVDFGFLVFVLQLGVGLVFIITLAHRLLFRGFHVDRVVIVAALVVGGGALGMAAGPTVPPAVTVVGSYTFTPSLPAVPATQGALACEWANGRWRIGILTTTTRSRASDAPRPHRQPARPPGQLSDGAPRRCWRRAIRRSSRRPARRRAGPATGLARSRSTCSR